MTQTITAAMLNPAVPIGLDQAARDLATTAFIKADDTSGLQGPIFGSAFASDDLVTKTNAVYDAGGNYYHNTGGQAEISRLLGILIGDMTGEGGLSAAFDGYPTDSAGMRATGLLKAVAYVGKDYGAGNEKVITGVTITNVASGTGGSITTRVYASNSAPTNASDGILIKDFGSIPQLSDPSDLSISNTTAYRYVWVYFNDGTAAEHVRVGEVQFYEATNPTNMTLIPSVTTLDIANVDDLSFYVVVQEMNEADASVNIRIRSSIDGGSTFTTAAVADVVYTYGSADKLLRFDCDMQAQMGFHAVPEITTLNNEAFRIKEWRGMRYA